MLFSLTVHYPNSRKNVISFLGCTVPSASPTHHPGRTKITHAVGSHGLRLRPESRPALRYLDIPDYDAGNGLLLLFILVVVQRCTTSRLSARCKP